MNYELSPKILAEIKKASKILINCHYKPDPDGVGSALALALALKKLGKGDVTLICSSQVPEALDYLVGFDEIKTVKYSEFDFSKYDLWLISDASNWWQISGVPDFKPPEIKTIVIDHHWTNEINLPITLVEKGLSSACEVIYKLFEDWGLEIDKDMAQAILTGIIGDTGVFKFPYTTTKTLEISQKLMSLGADKDLIIYRTYGSTPLSEMKFWGKILNSLQIDEEYHFVWSAVSFEEYESLGKPVDAKGSAASNFAGSVAGTDFGVFMVEEVKNVLGCSFRARGKYDISPIAQELGGGGHKEAAGARILNTPFNEAVEKVLAVARKYAKKAS